MSIRLKLLLNSALPVFGLLTVAIAAALSIQGLRGEVTDLSEQRIQVLANEQLPAILELEDSIRLMLNADRDAYQALTAEQQLGVADDAESWQELNASSVENLGQTRDRLVKASAAFTPEMQTVYQMFLDSYQQWHDATREVFENARADGYTQAMKEAAPQRAELFATMRHQIDQLQILQEARIVEYQKQVSALATEAQTQTQATSRSAASAMWLVITVSVVASLAVVALTFWITTTITHGIGHIVQRLTDISEGDGDLTQQIEVKGTDELAQLGNGFNRFVTKTHDLIAQAKQTMTAVDQSVNEIGEATTDVNHRISEQNQEINSISAAVQELSAAIQQVAEKADHVSSESEKSHNTARDGGQVVQETVSGMQAIEEAVSSTATSVGELGKRSEQIGHVITVINDIADQTNLLALNAAIEAARAGEHGRGFAVVADEVRKLADRTTKATEEIAESIKAIQSETDQAVGRMESGKQRVNEGVEKAGQAGEALRSIVTGIEGVVAMIGEIAATTKEQSQATEGVTRGIEQIATASQTAAHSCETSAQASAQLSTQARDLSQLLGQFKVK